VSILVQKQPGDSQESVRVLAQSLLALRTRVEALSDSL
jgi:hypothetical protein